MRQILDTYESLEEFKRDFYNLSQGGYRVVAMAVLNYKILVIWETQK